MPISTTCDSSLLTLPVEILCHIIDYLDTPTIFLSLSNVCTYFRAIVNTYNQYKINLRSVSKSYFHCICRLIQPDNILSLTLSDDKKTPGQIKLFLSLFNIDQFPRLFSLGLLEIDDDDLSKILYSNITSTLNALLINWRKAYCPANKTLTLLSSTLNRLTLYKLELKAASYAIGEMSWPIQYTLNHLTLMYVTQKQYCTILQNTPHLKTLALDHCSMYEVDENVSTLSTPILHEQLTSLILTDSRISMVGLLYVLSLTPLLTYLKIIAVPDLFDAVADGSHWEQFIHANLPLLNKFEFFFTNMYNVYYMSKDVQMLISRFQTPFWLTEKHWFVTCDYIDYRNQIMLYTSPVCSTNFIYECQTNKMSYFADPVMYTGATITDNVRTISVTLTKLLTGVATMKNATANRYLFRNVTKLMIDVDQEWSTECVQYLSKILDFSRLDKITFNPDFNPNLIHNTTDNINLLLEFAYNLNTLAIHPYSSDHGIVMMENISAIIPHRIKHLEVTVNDINSMKIILDNHEHLWSLTFLAASDQSLPWSEFIEELVNRRNDFEYRETYFSLRIWFGQKRHELK